MSLVPVRRIWDMQRFYIERKRLDNFLLTSDIVNLFPEKYYLDISVVFNGMRSYLPFLARRVHNHPSSRSAPGIPPIAKSKHSL